MFLIVDDTKYWYFIINSEQEVDATLKEVKKVFVSETLVIVFVYFDNISGQSQCKLLDEGAFLIKTDSLEESKVFESFKNTINKMISDSNQHAEAMREYEKQREQREKEIEEHYKMFGEPPGEGNW